MTKKELAQDLRAQGYNCAQAVLCAHCEELGLPEDVGKLIAAAFGNGLGDTSGICGAALGGLMVLGLRHGENRSLTRLKTLEFKNAFLQRVGDLNCGALKKSGVPCNDLVDLVCDLLA